MQYSITFKNISENDQLVLRLIFSLSAKARGRNHSYCLFENDATRNPDICIQLASAESALAADASHGIVWLAVEDTRHTGISYVIKKPLIASRVLSVLDHYVGEQLNATAKTEPPAPDIDVALSVTSVQTADSEPEMEFSISEEEASQLAIVDDEALSNPANTIPQAFGGNDTNTPINSNAETNNVTSLIVLHNNKETEVSKQAFDTKLLGDTETKPHALVVDDSPSVRKQIELELDLFNVEVDFAESVADATAQLQQHEYDLVFLDVVLPDGDGFGICRAIRAGTSHPTVIMLTGKATPADKIKGTMAGCDAYLVKPVGRMTFQNTVCNYLQLRDQLEVIHTSSGTLMEKNHGYQ